MDVVIVTHHDRAATIIANGRFKINGIVVIRPTDRALGVGTFE